MWTVALSTSTVRSGASLIFLTKHWRPSIDGMAPDPVGMGVPPWVDAFVVVPVQEQEPGAQAHEELSQHFEDPMVPEAVVPPDDPGQQHEPGAQEHDVLSQALEPGLPVMWPRSVPVLAILAEFCKTNRHESRDHANQASEHSDCSLVELAEFRR
jgi:hypothetical protein